VIEPIGPLNSIRVPGFHSSFGPACDALREIRELIQLVDDPCALLVGAALVVRMPTVGGIDPGGVEA
jgi:hypothetical protein